MLYILEKLFELIAFILTYIKITATQLLTNLVGGTIIGLYRLLAYGLPVLIFVYVLMKIVKGDSY